MKRRTTPSGKSLILRLTAAALTGFLVIIFGNMVSEWFDTRSLQSARATSIAEFPEVGFVGAFRANEGEGISLSNATCSQETETIRMTVEIESPAARSLDIFFLIRVGEISEAGAADNIDTTELFRAVVSPGRTRVEFESALRAVPAAVECSVVATGLGSDGEAPGFEDFVALTHLPPPDDKG